MPLSLLYPFPMIAQNFKEIMEALPKATKLIAVSKQQPEERIEEALSFGHRVYGENRIQEAYQRWEKRRAQYGGDLELHLIGPLQSNKAAEAVALFDVIHTLDRPKIAKALAAEMKKQERDLPCFIQVNIGEENQKSGIMPADLHDFYEYCSKECGLNVMGLMCIPPIDEPAALYFALLKKMATSLGISSLSMGMSSDYEKAVALGATHIRIGSALFGARG